MINKKALGGSKIHFVSLILILGVILTMSFVLAAHVITTSTGGISYSVNEDIGFIYNITVNNTDTTNSANITYVNITIPNTIFVFLANSNATSAGTHTFTNTSSVLSWSNDGLVMNLTHKYFWFNATASTPGSYNITVTTTNVTGSFSSNISLTINDTTLPSSIEFVSPTESNNANLSRSNIAVNITAADNGIINTIIIRLFNSTRNQINSSSSSTSPVFINFTGLSDGVYYFNATINDSYGNSNSTSTRTVTLDTTRPVITLIAPADSTSSTTSAYNFTFNVSDSRNVANCTLVLDGSIINILTGVNNSGGTNGMYNDSLGITTHTWNVNCTDFSGNTGNSSTRTLIVAAEAAAEETSSGGGGSLAYGVNNLNSAQMSAGYTKEYAANGGIKFKIGGEDHSVKVVWIGVNSALLTIASTPQDVTLFIGEEKKFNLNYDEIYDLSVKLNSIDSVDKTINLTVKAVFEPIPAASSSINQEAAEKKTPILSEDAGEAGITGRATAPEAGFMNKYLTWVIIGCIAIVISIAFIWIVFRKKN